MSNSGGTGLNVSFEALFALHPDAVFVMDADGVVQYENPAASGLLDDPARSRADPRRHYRHAIRSDEFEMFQYYFQRAVVHGETRSFDMALLPRLGGGPREVRVQLVPLDGGDRRAAGVAVYMRASGAAAGGTAPETALDSIGASFIESHSDPILVLDRSAKIVLSNASFSKLLGWRKDQLEGFHILQCPSIPPYLVSQMNEFVTRVFAGGDDEATMETIRMTDQGREYQMLLTLTPVRDRAGFARYWAVHLRDITKRKMLEEQLRQIELEQSVAQELRELEHLKTVSQLAASISHEVRNPLTVTRGFMQLLRGSALDEEKRLRYFDLSLEELDRAERIITDYLTFAKPAFEHPERLELGAELERIVQVILPFAGMANIAVNLVPCSEKLFVHGEGKKLHQALVNVLKNGIEATPAGGNITVRLERREGRSLLIVEDTGKGMGKEQLGKLGTPYYTTKDKGTGLGTMVAFSIFRAMQAEVNVESEPGRGTRIVLSFPAAE